MKIPRKSMNMVSRHGGDDIDQDLSLASRTMRTIFSGEEKLIGERGELRGVLATTVMGMI
jgi:hypothetical protein